jgi:hypothetical protein
VPLALAIRNVRFYMRDIATRMPFRFGAVTLTGFPLLHAAVEVTQGGRVAVGYAADNLVPRWFDKDSAKPLARNIDDLIASAELAAAVYDEAGEAPSLFALWREAYPECQRRAAARGINRLTGAFGSALIERAAIDALGRARGRTVLQMLRDDELGLRPDMVHPETSRANLEAWLAAPQAESIALRHTVGMLDPLLDGEVPDDARDDGLPRSLEAYIRRQGLRRFKLKLAGDIDKDTARLEAIADVLDRLAGEGYRATLDGNEQYHSSGDVAALLTRIEANPRLARLRASLLFLEQPLDRAAALAAGEATGIAAVGRRLPVIIDESDDDPHSFALALERGYAGVSTKNCKGVIKSFLNRTLMEARRARGERVFMSAEDLTNLPILPLQQDLLTVRLLGIDHVERNGHHYVRGLDHCSARERAGALEHHGDLYEKADESAVLRIRDGRLSLRSLDVPGYGVIPAPDLDDMIPLAAWRQQAAR